MLLGTEKIQEAVDGLVGGLSEEVGDTLAEVEEVMLVVALHYGPADEPNADVSSLAYRCSSSRMFVQLGLLEHAELAVVASTRRHA